MKALSSEGLKAMFHQLDINDLDSIKTAAAYFKGKYGGVDILINNVGIAFKGIYTLILTVLCTTASYTGSSLTTSSTDTTTISFYPM